MASGKFDFREIRFVIEPEITHCFVRTVSDSDPTLATGWWHEVFPASRSVVDILTREIDSGVLLWDRGTPVEK